MMANFNFSPDNLSTGPNAGPGQMLPSDNPNRPPVPNLMPTGYLNRPVMSLPGPGINASQIALSSPLRPLTLGAPGLNHDFMLGSGLNRFQGPSDSIQTSPTGVPFSMMHPPGCDNGMGLLYSHFPPPKMGDLNHLKNQQYYPYGLSMPATLRELTEASVADEWESNAQALVPTVATPTPSIDSSSESTARSELASGFSSTASGPDSISHWIAVCGTEPADVRSGVVSETLRMKSRLFEQSVDITVGDVLFFEIDSLKRAPFAKAAVRIINPAWSAEYVSSECLRSHCHPAIDGIDGQLKVTVILTKEADYSFDISQSGSPDKVMKFLCSYFNQTWGLIRASQLIHFDLANRTLAFRLEFDSLAAYRTMMKECRGKILVHEGLNFEIDIWQPALPSPAATEVTYSIASLPASSPTRQTHSPTTPRSHSVQLSNIVSKERIRSGQDVRTTIMLRNIPNRIDVHQFKAFLDRTSFGHYDFSYLRIDFQTNSNVGYAFINFVNASSIIPFADAVSGRQWIEWGSQKTAQISYATIQGRDCLIQKFRNSSVMRECSEHRPKLWYSVATPNIHSSVVGSEEPFPSPDNHAKLQRSIDNAAHQGLYPPRSGEAGADGTSGAVWDHATLDELAERLITLAEARYGRR